MLPIILFIGVLPLLVLSQDLNLTAAHINVRLVASSYNLDVSVNTCISKISQEFGMGDHNVLMEDSVVCDLALGICRSVVVEFPKSKTIYFIYRGSTQIPQIALQGPPITQDFLGLGQVKRYYVRASHFFWELQKHIVMDSKYQDYKFVYTGHSLGGSLAFLSAMRAVIQGKIPGDQIELMTFGEPRSGHRNLTKKIKNYIKNDFRITHSNDNAKTFPACRSIFSLSNKRFECDPGYDDWFYHHGMEYWFSDDRNPSDRYKKCDALPEYEDPTCLARNPTLLGLKIWCDHIVYLGLNMLLYGVSGCEIPRIVSSISCPIPI